MAQINLNVQKRTALKKQEVKRLRKKGAIPGVVYGKHTEPISIQIDDKDFSSLAHGEHGASLESILINLNIGDGGKTEKKTTLIKELQHDQFTGAVTHIDFNEISMSEKIHTRLPIITTGEAKGEKQGGILDYALREIEISCYPADLPEEIRIDISDLGPHDSIHVRDIDLGDKVEILNDGDLPIVSIIVPRIVEEVVEEVEEVEETEEPEVITRKAEKEGEEAAQEK